MHLPLFRHQRRSCYHGPVLERKTVSLSQNVTVKLRPRLNGQPAIMLQVPCDCPNKRRFVWNENWYRILNVHRFLEHNQEIGSQNFQKTTGSTPHPSLWLMETAFLSWALESSGSFKNFTGPFRLIVVEGSQPSLLGLDWFISLGLEVTGIYHITNSNEDTLICKFTDVFNSTLRQYTETPTSFNVDPQVTLIWL